MNRIIILSIFLLSAIHTYSQNHIKTFSKCGSGNLFSIAKGDTLIIDCDTVLILNKKYAGKYNEIFKTYHENIELLNTRIKEQDSEYNKLKEVYNALLLESVNYIKNVDSNIKSLDNSVKNSITYLSNAQTDISEIKKDIKKSRHSGITKSNIIWGTGGLILGLLIYIIAK